MTIKAPKRHHKDAAATASDVLYTQTIGGSITSGSQVSLRLKSGTTVNESGGGNVVLSQDKDFGPYEVTSIDGATVKINGNTAITSVGAGSANDTVFLIPFMPEANLSTSVIDQRKVQVFIADAIKDTSATPNL